MNHKKRILQIRHYWVFSIDVVTHDNAVSEKIKRYRITLVIQQIAKLKIEKNLKAVPIIEFVNSLKIFQHQNGNSFDL